MSPNSYYSHLHVQHVPLCPLCPLCVTQDVAVRLRPHTQTDRDRQRDTDSGHTQPVFRVLLGLNGWYTGLEIRLFQVSSDRVRLTSYAAFLTRSSDNNNNLPERSICGLSVLPPSYSRRRRQQQPGDGYLRPAMFALSVRWGENWPL